MQHAESIRCEQEGSLLKLRTTREVEGFPFGDVTETGIDESIYEGPRGLKAMLKPAFSTFPPAALRFN